MLFRLRGVSIGNEVFRVDEQVVSLASLGATVLARWRVDGRGRGSPLPWRVKPLGRPSTAEMAPLCSEPIRLSVIVVATALVGGLLVGVIACGIFMIKIVKRSRTG